MRRWRAEMNRRYRRRAEAQQRAYEERLRKDAEEAGSEARTRRNPRYGSPPNQKFKLLQPFHLLDLARLLPPPIMGDLAHSYLADRVREVLRLRDQYIDLSQLGDDLFRLVSLPPHIGPPSCQMTYFRSDHFNEGGSSSA